MVQRKVDFIIVGQGIAGSWLAYELIQRDKEVLIFNHETDHTATLKAAGLYNPITGRKMVRTWLADQLFLNLEEKYHALEGLLKNKFLHSMPIYRPFHSVEEKNDWDGRIETPEYQSFVSSVERGSLYPGIQDELGGIVLKKTGYVNLEVFTSSMRDYFNGKGCYKSELFDYERMGLEKDQISYKEFTASKIIFCEGPNTRNHYWDDLPFRNVRGELFDMRCGLESEHIINRSVFMIPKDGYFTVGSTYDHKVLSFEPQKEGIEDLKTRLSKLFMNPYRIIGKRAGVRPATYDRKPFIGLHRKFKEIGIFNGFGTKGVSLTPYFAAQFADFLVGHAEIDKEANVQRVF